MPLFINSSAYCDIFPSVSEYLWKNVFNLRYKMIKLLKFVTITTVITTVIATVLAIASETVSVTVSFLLIF